MPEFSWPITVPRPMAFENYWAACCNPW